MPLTLIEGQYRILNSAPDGDSVRFYPSDPQAFAKAGLPVRTNQAGGAQLRLDGIDALETHYQPQTGNAGVLHQPFEFGRAAAEALLTSLGFTAVRRGQHETVTSSTPAQAPGYVLTRSARRLAATAGISASSSQRRCRSMSPRSSQPVGPVPAARRDGRHGIRGGAGPTDCSAPHGRGRL
jgi:hypothetical protein